ncbi:MAG: cytochrome c [Burkholderiaceae bacterium]
MDRRSLSGVLLAVALGCQGDAFAADANRGRLLYDTGCNACHTQQAHWREKRVATDLASLASQVRRWAGVAGFNWSEEEIQDVVLYLDDAIYRFPPQRR